MLLAVCCKLLKNCALHSLSTRNSQLATINPPQRGATRNLPLYG
jgi:hypothetical protein